MKVYTITTFGCHEYLRHTGRVTYGALDFIAVKPRQPTIADIQERVARHFGVSPLSMTSPSRRRIVTRPRQIAMSLARELTPHSLPDIGRDFGNRDHTTVIHAMRQVLKLRIAYPEINAEWMRLEAELRA